MTTSMMWFVAGAFSALVARHIFFMFEVRSSLLKMVTQYLLVCQNIKKHLELALAIKKDHLLNSDLPENDVKDLVKKDEDFIRNWDTTATKILLTSIPKRYYNYFNSTPEE